MGVVSALGAAMIYGLVLSLMQYEVAELDGRLRTLLTMAAVGTLSLFVGGAGGALRWPDAAARWWRIALLTVCFGTGFTMLFSRLPKLGVVSNSPILNIEPVTVLVLAWMALGLLRRR